MLGPAEYRGAVQFAEAKTLGLMRLGFCDTNVAEMRPETVEQVRLIAYARGKRATPQQIAQPRCGILH